MLHSDKETDERTERHNDSNISFSQFLLRFNKARFLEGLPKIHQQFLFKLLITEGQTDRGTDIMNRISQFRYTVTNALHIYRRPEKFLAFLQTVEPISHYCLSGQHSYTRVPLADTNALNSDGPDFNFYAEIQTFWISLWHCLVTFLFKSQLASWQFQFIKNNRTHCNLMSIVCIK